MPGRFVVLAAFVVILGFAAGPSYGQQAPAATGKQAAASAQAQPDLEKKFAAIMKSDGTKEDGARRIRDLERFIRENPGFGRLEAAYANLLTFLTFDTSNPAKTIAVADEALKKFPKTTKIPVRGNAVGAKYAALRAQKNEAAITKLSEELLASEADPGALEEAADADSARAIALYEKAVAERAKNPSTEDYPRLDDLRWSYAQCLKDAGRQEEALGIWRELVEADKQQLAHLEALPKDDPKRKATSRLRMTMGSRYEGLAKLYVDKKEYDLALEYVTLTEQAAAYNPLESAARYANLRADIYAKAGKPELELEQRTRALAARLDPKVRDTIEPLAAKLSTSFDAVLARARDIRKTTAVTVASFELKALDGKRVALDMVKAKVTLVNFFFPT